MDKSFHQQESEAQHPDGLLAGGLQIINGILDLLSGLIQLTEEEQEDAGIYIGDQSYK